MGICFQRLHSLTRREFLMVCLVVGTYLAFTAGCSESHLSDVEYVAQAKDHLSNDHTEEAIIELKNALQRNLNNMEARWLLGEAYLKRYDGESAEKELRRALELGVVEESVMVSLAKALMIQGKTRELIKDVRVQGRYPPIVKAKIHALRGEAYILLDKLEQGEVEVENSLEFAGDSPEALFGHALLEFVRGDWDKSQTLLDGVVQTKPDFANAWALQGDIARLRNDHSTAAMAYEKAVAAEPYAIQYQIALADAKINVGNVEEGVRLLDVMLEIAPDDPKVNSLRAVAAYRNTDFAGARAFAEKAWEQQPDDLRSRLIDAAASYRLGEYERSLRIAKIAVSMSPDNDFARKVLAAAELKSGSVEGALENIGAVQSITEDDVALLTAIASAALSEGLDKQSVRAHTAALAVRPTDALIKTKMAIAEIRLGNQDEAIALLERALEVDPSMEAQASLVIAHLKSENYDQALAIASAIQKSNPSSPHGYTLAGMVYGLQGNKDDAKAFFVKALEVSPGDPNAGVNLAELVLLEGDAAEARRLYLKVLTHNPDDLKALLKLGSLDTRLGRYSDAITAFQAAVKTYPNALEPRIALSGLYLKLARPQQSLAVAKPALLEHPASPKLLEFVGRSQTEIGAYVNAIGTLQKWAEIVPTKPEPNYYLGIARERSGDLAGALQEVEKALEVDKSHMPSQFAHARLLAATGKFEAAQTILSELKDTVPDSSVIPELEGNIALAQNRPQDAIGYFESVLKLRQSSLLVIQLARAQWLTGNTEASLTTLSDWLSKNPQDVAARKVRASGLILLGQLPEAKQEYAEVLRQSPDSFVVHNDYAWTLHRLGELEEALVHAERARVLAPENPRVMDTLGVILLAKREVDAAAKILAKAAELAPDNLTIQFHLAQALAENAQEKEAREVLYMLLASERPFDDREEAKRLLESLE